MTGLLRKDLYVADKSSRLLLVMALIFNLIPNWGTLGNTYAMMLAYMLPLNSIAYDERCKWDRYAAMLPYTHGQIVWSKYLLGGFYTLLGMAIILAGAVIRSIVQPGSVDWLENLRTVAVLAIVMVLIVSLGLPALYRFGSEKGRLVMFLILAVGVGSAVAVTKLLLKDNRLAWLPVPVIAATAAALVAGMTYASFRLSVHFYRKRLNGAYV